jgi:hypothetical protein
MAVGMLNKEKVMSDTVGQPVKALVESVLNGEWVAVSDTYDTLLLNHDMHKLELTFAKINVQEVGSYDTQSYLRLVDAEWMEAAEKRWVEGSLNDWWAKKRKGLDAERRAEARNKYMCLVKENNGQA